ncbi:hypothetical protein, partial [Paraburkholderia ginsengiterrae]|uniref:hypothetical protein n=1 Tax=Paraburkholderia ginsengiterrae TaxID=1462993 RepID=UPI000A616E1B
LLSNLRLNRHGAAKDPRYSSLNTGDSRLEYEAGAALGWWPRNCSELVDDLIAFIGFSPNPTSHVAAPRAIRPPAPLRKPPAIAPHHPDPRPHPTLAHRTVTIADHSVAVLLDRVLLTTLQLLLPARLSLHPLAASRPLRRETLGPLVVSNNH